VQPDASRVGLGESKDDEVQYGDVKTVGEQSIFGDSKSRLEDEEVQIYKVEIATNERFWN
jgi:hypothetical protein